MPMPVTFPDWVPWWMQLLLVVVVILLGLAFLFMPFSVFGVKSRLEGVEARLDEIQNEIRSLALRLPEPGRGAGFDDEMVLRASASTQAQSQPRVSPPIPPASWETEGRGGPRTAARGGRVDGRAEPRLGR